jgi:hypothetical protein
MDFSECILQSVQLYKIFKNNHIFCFSTFMAGKKAAKKTKAKTTKTKTGKTTKSTTSKTKKPKEEPFDDMGLVIVDDDIIIDQEKINEERRAYLEEARSQEASD